MNGFGLSCGCMGRILIMRCGFVLFLLSMSGGVIILVSVGLGVLCF